MMWNLTLPTTANRPCCFHLPNTFREGMFVWDPSRRASRRASRLPGFPASRLHGKGRSLAWPTFQGLALIWSKETGDRWWCRTPLCTVFHQHLYFFSCHLLLLGPTFLSLSLRLGNDT